MAMPYSHNNSYFSHSQDTVPKVIITDSITESEERANDSWMGHASVCDFCHTPMNSSTVNDHQKTVCTKYPTFCIFALLGCTEKVERGELDNHHNNCTQKHLCLLNDAVTYFNELVSTFSCSTPTGASKPLCSGLENVGNTCFVNAVLQALSACPAITLWLKNFLGSLENISRPQYLATTLLEILSAINNDCEAIQDTYSNTQLLAELRYRRWRISPDEQDAHEFFHVVMETLDEEATRYPTVISLFDTKTLESPDNRYQPLACAQTRSHGLLPLLPRRCADNPFRGLLASHLKCTKCGYEHPVKYGAYDSLSLSIPNKTWGSVTLKDLLTNFIQSERVEDVECPGCAKHNYYPPHDLPLILPRSPFIKKTTLAKLPQCLCIHIQRTAWLDNGSSMKRFNRVVFPEILGLDDYAYITLARAGPRGLCGGNNASHRPTNLALGSPHPLQPTDLSPPMNLLRALNFQSQSPSNGFLLQSPSTVAMTTSNVFTDINQNTPNIPEVLPRPDFQYKLTANVCHYGDAMCGHFVTCRRAPSFAGEITNSWVYTSDTEVRFMPPVDVYNEADVYMLFYERV